MDNRKSIKNIWEQFREKHLLLQLDGTQPGKQEEQTTHDSNMHNRTGIRGMWERFREKHLLLQLESSQKMEQTTTSSNEPPHWELEQQDRSRDSKEPSKEK